MCLNSPTHYQGPKFCLMYIICGFYLFCLAPRQRPAASPAVWVWVVAARGALMAARAANRSSSNLWPRCMPKSAMRPQQQQFLQLFFQCQQQAKLVVLVELMLASLFLDQFYRGVGELTPSPLRFVWRLAAAQVSWTRAVANFGENAAHRSCVSQECFNA